MVGVYRVDKKTPCGGDYSIMFCMDGDGNLVPKEKAEFYRIEEYSKDGTLISTTYGVKK